jgi:PD-(D/E)XK nuclease superfamily
MPRQPTEAHFPPRVSLHLATSFEAAWHPVLLPWFKKEIPRAVEHQAPVAVVTPFRSHAYFLRSKLLAHGVSLLGVKFLPPAQLRKILRRGTGLNIPLREHLRLLFAIAAEKIAATNDGEKLGYLIAKSVARDPDHFLRIFDELGVAGWSLSEIGEPVLSEIATCFEELCRECRFTFVHQADRLAVENAGILPARFSSLLITGFDGAHWPVWPLLHAAVKSSARATVVLSDPRDEARDIDETWVGTWEEAFGTAEPVGETHDFKRPETFFLVGRDATEQARVIVALTAKFLSEDNCKRIGVLFPQKGALPRLVAGFLESAQIAHNDGIAHPIPSVFDDEAWRPWLELQQNPRLKFLFRFLRAVDAKIFEKKISIFEVEDALRRTYADVLIDNIEILREACARSEDKVAISRELEKIQFLSATATFAEFLEQTKKIFAQFGWKQRWNEVERLSRGWAEQVRQRFSKASYLRWLHEILGAPSLSRDELGAHPYSRVHLLPYSEAEGQSWSHLIFAGLNEEAWPAIDEEFIGDQQIDEFNERNRILNRHAVKRGRHGEGQWSIADGKTFLLGSAERRQVRRRQLRNLMESAAAGIGVTANLYSENSPSRIANPTEFFSRVYFEARDRGVSQQTLQALEEQTRAWLSDWSPVDAQKVDSISVGRTHYAYRMRREVAATTEYDFALRSPPDRPVTLRVTEWETALKWPAIIWMKIFLGVEPDDKSGDAWARAMGLWVHHWLAHSVKCASADPFVEIRELEEIRTRLLERARRFRDQIADLCAACAQPLPDWWTSGWHNAVYVADCLAAKLSGLASDWTQMAPEFCLDSPTNLPISANESLRVSGRIDLILARGEQNQSRISFPELWIVDYKTGRQRAFTLYELRKKENPQQKLRRLLVKGRGVQLGLYALAAHALGASRVQLSLLGLADELESQFDLAHVLAQKDFWRALYRMQETGVFGMLGPVHSEYGFAHEYPLATLGIDEDLLKQKWALTHPEFTVEMEENA